LMLPHIEEKIWWRIILPFLKTLSLRSIAHEALELSIDQQSFKLEALLREVSDLMLRPPWAIGLQIFFQEIVTSFLLSKSPLQIKFRIHFSKSLRRETGQEYKEIL
jgi:hypothetical protein